MISEAKAQKRLRTHAYTARSDTYNIETDSRTHNSRRAFPRVHIKKKLANSANVKLLFHIKQNQFKTIGIHYHFNLASANLALVDSILVNLF